MSLRKQIIIYVGLGVIFGLIYALASIPFMPVMLLTSCVLYIFIIPVVIFLEAIAIAGLCRLNFAKAFIASILLNIISALAITVILVVRVQFPDSLENYSLPIIIGLLGVLCLFVKELKTTGRIAIGTAVLQIIFAAVAFKQGEVIKIAGASSDNILLIKYYLDLIAFMCIKTMVEYWLMFRSFKPDVTGTAMLIANASVFAFIAIGTLPMKLLWDALTI